MLDRLMVPLDGSALAEQALPLARAIARRAGSEIHLIQVHDPARGDYLVLSLALPVDPDPITVAWEETHLRGMERGLTEAGQRG